MSNAIRQVLVVLPLGLMLAGCASPHGSIFSAGPANPQVGLAGERTTATAVDRSGLRNDEMAASDSGEPSAADSQHYISLEQFRKSMQNPTTVVIDARSPESFASGHVRGATNLPAGAMEANLAPISANVASSQLIIVYCASSSCGAGDKVSEYLEAHGYTNVHVFRPGWAILARARDLQ